MLRLRGKLSVRVNHSLKGSLLAILFGLWFDPFKVLFAFLFIYFQSIAQYYYSSWPHKQECLGRLLLHRQSIGLASPYTFSILPQKRNRMDFASLSRWCSHFLGSCRMSRLFHFPLIFDTHLRKLESQFSIVSNENISAAWLSSSHVRAADQPPIYWV